MSGRRSKGYEVLSVRELSADEVKHLRRAKLPAVKRLRHAHHRLALLIATGMQDSEVSIITGYSLSRIGALKADPAFRDLVSIKAGMIQANSADQIAEYNALILTNGIKAEQFIADKLDAAMDSEDDDIPWAVLLKASRDAADRVGLAKRSVALNVNVDFASQLQKAVQRSRMKVIEGTQVGVSAQASQSSVNGGSRGWPPDGREGQPMIASQSETHRRLDGTVIEAAPASPPTLLGDARVEGTIGAPNGKEASAQASPRPVLIHVAPDVKPALAKASVAPLRPGLVTRRTA
jgi:hypothetical protein